MIRRLLHPWLTVRAAFLLGAVFVVAALPKIADPPAFAKAIHAYRLFPAALVHPAALALPWLELLTGAALCLGWRLRAAALWTGTLLLAFVAALSINLARHHPVDCGCFDPHATTRSEAERLGDMRWTILRDLGLLLLVGQVLLASGRREDGPHDPSHMGM